MKYFTGSGDSGTSTLYGSAKRLPKSNPVFEVLGSLDELNSYLGICRAHAKGRNIAKTLETVQKDIFIIQAEIGSSKKSPVETITEKKVKELEEHLASLAKELPEIRSFTVPGESILSAHLDYARTLARKAERLAISLKHAPKTPTLSYLNRLSSLLFVMARAANAELNLKEKKPDYT
ncbi:MAG: ATP:cob(I)alamin adenosyltransferase [Candidatus Sungbacteria bacterium RIFCSPLOWO2_01_FULL_47_32]|uniref:Corrinoid adenosyltransferase n=1 Tax=Candidatus Sungbacteria bacterium RIFCSPHIGHO2_01_FULL_47_32 TaxID=1802264 RepID=A0A1G2K7U3_9BACT|nr:MAG: ATP:cob(I)alamin adenosyltransferase [Candidatus Sungbacteria bacterium RIFCSPHIGHO2_01_FULL_47_32]OGZ99257.1 MAG: ATP:cob(I)alamin adenosyltransferase [Candidatus Sungbacteria bacterium RIFCSPHIGHO2_02_FULL_46_12]OHA04997.1 MAG: ATP:cob(I)alamin adenosyltransferase [Candidatus Sungbacteria bacterium RIFCSPLOWO2_01_FULL_47_32]